MSMPQPIHVALVGSSGDIVRRAKRHFRLSAPEIGAAYLATLESEPSDDLMCFEQLPSGLITLWVALDADSLSASERRYHADTLNPRYDRGFYNDYLPEPCVFVDFEKTEPESRIRLVQLAKRIVEAWYATS